MATATADTGAGEADEGRGRTPAQWYCLVVGLVLIAAGIAGFFVNSSFDQAEFGLNFDGDPVNGDLLLGLEVNGWHNIVHIATGLLLLVGFPKPASARTILLVFGVAYVAVTVIGFIDERNVLGIIPVNTADNFLHLALAVTALIAALLPASRARRD